MVFKKSSDPVKAKKQLAKVARWMREKRQGLLPVRQQPSEEQSTSSTGQFEDHWQGGKYSGIKIDEKTTPRLPNESDSDYKLRVAAKRSQKTEHLTADNVNSASVTEVFQNLESAANKPKRAKLWKPKKLNPLTGLMEVDENADPRQSGPGTGGGNVTRAPPTSSGSGGSSGGSGAAGSGSLMPIMRPITHAADDWKTCRYTKSFRLQFKNVNWIREVITGTSDGVVITPEDNVLIQAPYYCFPIDKKWWYMNPAEWIQARRNKSEARIVSTKFQITFDGHRSFFETGSTNVTIASNQSTPYLYGWENMRKIAPYMLFHNEGGEKATTVGELETFDPLERPERKQRIRDGQYSCNEILTRLYGDHWDNTGEEGGEKDGTTGLWQKNEGKTGACDTIVDWHLRPTWAVTKNYNTAGKTQPDAKGDFISGLNMFKHAAFKVAAQNEGFGMEVNYAPKNNILMAETSLMNDQQFRTNWQYEFNGTSNNPTYLFADRVLNGYGYIRNGNWDYEYPISGTSVFATRLATDEDFNPEIATNAKAYDRGYFDSIGSPQYQYAEHLNDVTDTAPDIIIGMCPQIQPDKSVLTGMTEITVETEMIIQYKENLNLAYKTNIFKDNKTRRTIANLYKYPNLGYNDKHVILKFPIHDFANGYGPGGHKPLSLIGDLIPTYSELIDKASQLKLDKPKRFEPYKRH